MRNSILLIFVLSCLSCDYFKQETQETPVARVNDSYLYQSDIEGLVSDDTTPEDSTMLVNSYINRWATQQLLIDQAKINLPEDEQETYNKLVAEYKIDLYTEAYKSTIVAKQLDSAISETEYQRFYEENKETFTLNEPLVKVRYLQVGEGFNRLNETSQWLSRFNEEDQQRLNDLSIQYKSFNLNDSTWVKFKSVAAAIPPLAANTPGDLKNSNLRQLQDSLGVYLVKITEVLMPNDTAPIEFVRPTIEQIILNKRKLELIKKLEKDITKDAINNKKYETYTPY